MSLRRKGALREGFSPSNLLARVQSNRPRFPELIIYLLEHPLQAIVDLVALGPGTSVRLTHAASELVGLLALVRRDLRGLSLCFDKAFAQPALLDQQAVAFLAKVGERRVVALEQGVRHHLVGELCEGGLASGEAVLDKD